MNSAQLSFQWLFLVGLVLVIVALSKSFNSHSESSLQAYINDLKTERDTLKNQTSLLMKEKESFLVRVRDLEHNERSLRAQNEELKHKILVESEQRAAVAKEYEGLKQQIEDMALFLVEEGASASAFYKRRA